MFIFFKPDPKSFYSLNKVIITALNVLI